MERWLAALERRFGRHLPGNLTYWLVGLMGLTFVMEMVAPGFSEVLRLDPGKVLAGQVWRLVTWLALPPSQSPIFVVFALLWLYRMGATLERDWGAARYVAWWLVGVVCTAVAAFFLGMPGTNGYLLMALFLAYATLHPDERVLLFFVVPVPIKWLALLDGIGLLYLVGTLPGREALMPLVAVGNYLLFFTPTLVGLLRGFVRKGARAAEAKRFRGDEGRARVRRCALCGVTDEDPTVDIRVCSCAKCGRPTELCLPHARNH